MSQSFETADAPAGGYKFKVLPTYVVLDTSYSMLAFQQMLNDALMEIFDELATNPKVSEFIHLSIISFNTEPHLITGMTDIDQVETLPTVAACGGATNYGKMFRLVRDRIEIDVPTLRGVEVLRPVVFLVTDGEPTDTPAGSWVTSHAELTDPEWKPHPHIITYGLGDASEAVLKQVSTLAAYLADKDKKDKEAIREALATALSSLLSSLVASANAERLLVPEEVKGFKSVPMEVVDY